MKTSVLLVLVSTAACALSTATAAVCTTTQLQQIDSIAQKVGQTSACKKYSAAATTSTVSLAICQDSACLSTIRASVAQYPSCTVEGIDVKMAVTLALDACEDPSNLSTSSLPTTTTWTPTVTSSTTTISTRSPTPTTTRTPTPTTSRTPTPTITQKPTPTTASIDSVASISPLIPGLGSSDASPKQQAASTALVAASLAAVAYVVYA